MLDTLCGMTLEQERAGITHQRQIRINRLLAIIKQRMTLKTMHKAGELLNLMWKLEREKINLNDRDVIYVPKFTEITRARLGYTISRRNFDASYLNWPEEPESEYQIGLHCFSCDTTEYIGCNASPSDYNWFQDIKKDIELCPSCKKRYGALLDSSEYKLKQLIASEHPGW